MNTSDNMQYNSQCEQMTLLAEKFLPLNQLGFKQSAYLVRRHPIAIYDSQWCRVKFLWDGWDMRGGDTIGIYYGRLHASNDTWIITWEGRQCYCWHRANEALLFLDGLSPKEAVAHSKYGQLPNVMDAYLQSELGKKLTGVYKQPEWLTRMHAAIWEHYGQRFFELFDLRRPDLWERYAQFLTEFYKIEGLNPDITPSQDQIC